jgi:hypothetical protein
VVAAVTDETVEPEAVTEKGVTAGDAPEDVGASQSRRNTVSIQHASIHTYTRTCYIYLSMHTDSHASLLPRTALAMYHSVHTALL